MGLDGALGFDAFHISRSVLSVTVTTSNLGFSHIGEDETQNNPNA
jgi:hypothetical protein